MWASENTTCLCSCFHHDWWTTGKILKHKQLYTIYQSHFGVHVVGSNFNHFYLHKTVSITFYYLSFDCKSNLRTILNDFLCQYVWFNIQFYSHNIIAYQVLSLLVNWFLMNYYQSRFCASTNIKMEPNSWWRSFHWIKWIWSPEFGNYHQYGEIIT